LYNGSSVRYDKLELQITYISVSVSFGKTRGFLHECVASARDTTSRVSSHRGERPKCPNNCPRNAGGRYVRVGGETSPVVPRRDNYIQTICIASRRVHDSNLKAHALLLLLLFYFYNPVTATWSRVGTLVKRKFSEK